jgi:CRP/FNR family transcriptional regulator
MRCPVRALCIGCLAAQAGSRELQALMLPRQRLPAGGTLDRANAPAGCLHVVRSGSLKSCSCSDGTVQGLHFPGEVVGVDGLVGSRQPLVLVALEETELCGLRYTAPANATAGARAYLGRLWDMMSRELVRERAQAAWLGSLAPERRVAACLASLSLRVRAYGSPAGEFRLYLSPAEIAGYLRLSPEAVGRTLAALARGGLLQVLARVVRVLHPERVREVAKRK